jgi:hypothetical protein
MAVAIHVAPDDNFEDCVVRDNQGHEFGTMPRVTQPIARQLATKLFNHLPDDRTTCRNLPKRDRQTVRDPDRVIAAGLGHTLTPWACSRAHATRRGRGIVPA